MDGRTLEGRRAREGRNARARGHLCLPAVGAVCCAAVAVLAVSVCACLGAHTYPRVGNLFLSDVRFEYAGALSKWDVVGLSVFVQDNVPELVPTLHQLNPEIIVLGYVPASFLWASLETGTDMGPTIDSLANKVRECDWWLYDDRGNRVGDSTLFCTNLTSKCPPDREGKTLPEWLPQFFASQFLADGVWDGLILDGAYEQIHWMNNRPEFFQTTPAAIDCDRDGVPDHPESLDVWSKRGVEALLAGLREEAGADVIVVPNGNNYFYQYANGGIRENFPHMHGGWQENMFAPYGYIPMCDNFLDYPANVSMLWCYWQEAPDDLYDPGAAPSFERFNRFTLASALLGDGYYFLYRKTSGSLWWRDYYDLDLGDPVGEAYLDTIASGSGGPPRAVWRRDYENAKVLCNPFQQYLVLDDGTWIFPEDGLIMTYRLPGPISAAIDQSACRREFDRKDRAIGFKVGIGNPCPKAAQPYVWAELSDGSTTVVRGVPRQVLVGAGRTDTVSVGLRIPETLARGTHCLKVLLSGSDLLPVDSDTIYVTKVVSFEKDRRPVEDSDKTGFSLYPQPVFLSEPEPLTFDLERLASVGDLCSVKIYNVEGRLLGTLFEGRLDAGTNLTIDDRERLPAAPGVYFLEIETERESHTRKIVLLD